MCGLMELCSNKSAKVIERTCPLPHLEELKNAPFQDRQDLGKKMSDLVKLTLNLVMLEKDVQSLHDIVTICGNKIFASTSIRRTRFCYVQSNGPTHQRSTMPPIHMIYILLDNQTIKSKYIT